MKIKSFFAKACHTPYDKQTPVRSFFYKMIRIVFLSFKSFHRNELYLKSSLLTFYSLVSIVPILSIILMIAKGFGFDEFLQNQILQTFKEQQDVVSTAFRFSHGIIDHIKAQTIVGIGIFFLLFSVFGLFENIEKSLNTIWNVKKQRNVVRRWMNYIMALFFFPVIFIVSTSITLFINSEIVKTAQYCQFECLTSISKYVLMVLKFAPYSLMAALFSYIYLVTPNTKINILPRLFAGVLAGAIFQFWQILYIGFQVYISRYSIIYGSFAALPLFLIWMQINFVILLFGAEIAAHLEGDRFFMKSHENDHFITVDQKYLALMVLHEITTHFLKGEKPLKIDRISENLGISSLDAREVLNLLEKAGIIAEIRSSEKYQLIINPEIFTIQSISNRIEETFLKKSLCKKTASFSAVTHLFSRFEQPVHNSQNNLNLKEFVQFFLKKNH